ncbi:MULTISPECIES: S8 family serine peptidase [Vibrio]|uniref:S8 family serine peptidase n=1 Tax=Vibrio TaxID=662 RepID=UPI0001B94C24|nr:MULTISPECIES: S8 family serine peptidase [Vibrio]EEX32117.1 peptidase S8 and S53 subtilisin kexin sedolisin [Vibrio coralliilyticus ATCC BAA-450]MCM5509367.1 S8 family serine peptidase [Vibrio sp. SCSIO 43169]MDE3896705.1 S8 family serine peptidase [Vibrio sp. CC007]QFT39581.1 Subtilase family protein [Vibrio sp. THAF64]QGM37516.1 Subtilase family protein [Vibrio sp. THAF191d]
MIKHTALFAAMLVAGSVAPTHAETAQVEALAPQSWVVTGFVFKNDASESDIQNVESKLNHQATVLNHLKGFKNYTDHDLLYTRYQAAGYTFLVGPFPSDFSYIKSFQKQNASLGLIEPIKAGEEELDINVESILLSRSETQPGDAYINSFWEHGITGTGYTAAVLDSGTDIEHPAFVDKNVLVMGSEGISGEDYNWPMKREWLKTAGSRHLRSTHGTAVAGAMAGNSSISPHDGIAKDADVISGYAGSASDTLLPDGDGEFAQILRELKSANLTMSSLSYLTNYNAVSLNYSFGNGRILAPVEQSSLNQWQTWSFWARYFDAVSYENDFLLSKSAGNDGSKYPDGSSAEAPQPYSISKPGDNYNGLTVANVDTTLTDGPTEKTTDRSQHSIRATSSRGPTTDGRRKPDIAAPGHDTRTAAPDPNAYTYEGPYKDRFLEDEYKEYDEDTITRLATGTSLASPHVAGAAVLVRQALEESNNRQYQKFSPLVKAVLINSADNNSRNVLSEDLPQYCDSNGNWCPSRGWGYMDLTQAYSEYENTKQFELRPWSRSKSYRVASNDKNFKATLVWEHKNFDDASKLLSVDMTLYKDNSRYEIQSDHSEGIHNVLQVQTKRRTDLCIQIEASESGTFTPYTMSLASNTRLIPVRSCD